jgi:hypothetical protein
MSDGLEHQSFLAHGCHVDVGVEHAEGSLCVRIRVRGPEAAVHLNAEVDRFLAAHPTFRCSSVMQYKDALGWAALVVGTVERPAPKPKPTRERRDWTEAELEALHRIYAPDNLGACLKAFPGRSVSSIRCALRRYKRRVSQPVAV